VPDTLWLADAELGQKPTKSIDRLRPLPDEKLACPMHDENGLLLPGFDRHEAHGWAGDRLTDRFRVGDVVLTAFDVCLDVVRRHQADIVSERREFATPVMRRRACFHTDQTRRQLREEHHHLRAAQLLAEDDATVGPDAVKLENVLGEIDADGGDLHGECLLEALDTIFGRGRGPSTPSVSGRTSLAKMEIRTVRSS